MKFDIIIKDATEDDLVKISNLFSAKPKEVPKKISRVMTIFKIPFKCGSAEYQKALRLCKKHGGVPYLDALRKDGQLQVHAPPPSDEHAPGWKEIIKQSASPEHKPRINGDS